MLSLICCMVQIKYVANAEFSWYMINLHQGELQCCVSSLILRIGIVDSIVVQMMLQEVVNHNVDEEKGSVLECFTILLQQLLQNS